MEEKVLKPLNQLKFESTGEEFIFLYNSLHEKGILELAGENEEVPDIENLRQEYNLMVNENSVKNKYSKMSTYWNEEQEKAIIDYVKEKNQITKDKIFKTHLYKPFKKLIENIIFTYKLFRNDVEIFELQSDCMSFLITKIDKFDCNSGAKAFSYFGTIAKHYLMGEKKNIYKLMKITIGVEENEEEVNDKFLYTTEESAENKKLTTKLFEETILILEEELKQPKMLLNDKKVGEAIIWIFKNHETLNIYNKNLVYHLLKERTCLQTKDITYSLSRFKSFYNVFKHNFLKKNLA
jgi:hypothetical protein